MNRSVLPVILGALTAILLSACTGAAITPILKDVTLQEAYALIQLNQDNPGFIVLDVRTPGEFAEGHIEHAINVDCNSDTFQLEIDKLDKNQVYIVHCRSGVRSRKAVDLMAEWGFVYIYHIPAGFGGWLEAGLPFIK